MVEFIEYDLIRRNYDSCILSLSEAATLYGSFRQLLLPCSIDTCDRESAALGYSGGGGGGK